MRAVVQRASSASVTINSAETRSIGPGLAVFLGILKGDTESQAIALAEKIAGLRIFSDNDDKLNLSILDAGGEALVISNFTLSTDCRRGRRPSFDMAAGPDIAIPLYERFISRLRELRVKVTTGEFGADMRVPVENDGPVTIILDTEKLSANKKEAH